MATTDGMVRAAFASDPRLDHWRKTLVALCRIPGVSAAGFPLEFVAPAQPKRASLLAEEKPIDVFVDGRARLDLHGFVEQREARQQRVTYL